MGKNVLVLVSLDTHENNSKYSFELVFQLFTYARIIFEKSSDWVATFVKGYNQVSNWGEGMAKGGHFGQKWHIFRCQRCRKIENIG